MVYDYNVQKHEGGGYQQIAPVSIKAYRSSQGGFCMGGGLLDVELMQGDCLELMQAIPDESIDLTVTSPPYDNLRTYNGNIDQWSFEKFQGIAKQLYRVTKHGGVVVWVVGDATIKGSETGTSLRQALYFKEVGFNLHDTMIWNKTFQACHDYRNKRYKQEFEYMFIVSKGKPSTYNEICDRKTKNGGKIVKSATKRRTNGTIRKFGEILIKEYQARSNIWEIYPERGVQHPAPFPEQLAKDHIISWSNLSDVVLDPFMGSGSTGVACINTNRNFIGFELDADYFKIAERRIAEAQQAGKQLAI